MDAASLVILLFSVGPGLRMTRLPDYGDGGDHAATGYDVQEITVQQLAQQVGTERVSGWVTVEIEGEDTPAQVAEWINQMFV